MNGQQVGFRSARQSLRLVMHAYLAAWSAGQILKMKKFPMFGPRPRDNVPLREAINAPHRRP
jgi:hypothetical protein